MLCVINQQEVAVQDGKKSSAVKYKTFSLSPGGFVKMFEDFK